MLDSKMGLVSAVVVVVLSGCGGGGGGDAAPTVQTVVAGPVVSPSGPLVTSVPTTSYVAGSEELSAFNALNSRRSGCSFGKVAQAVWPSAAGKRGSQYSQGHIEGFFQNS